MLTNTQKVLSNKAKRVKQARCMATLTRGDLEKKYDIPENTLRCWENYLPNRKGITEEGVIRFINALEAEGVKCSANWLLHGTGKEPELISKQPFFGSSDDAIWEQEEALHREIEFFTNNHRNAVVLPVIDNKMEPWASAGDYVGAVLKTEFELTDYIGKFCLVDSKKWGTFFRKAKARLYLGENQVAFFTTNTDHVSIIVGRPERINRIGEVIWHRKREY